jgi:hypothetical protein
MADPCGPVPQTSAILVQAVMMPQRAGSSHQHKCWCWMKIKGREEGTLASQPPP